MISPNKHEIWGCGSKTKPVVLDLKNKKMPGLVMIPFDVLLRQLKKWLVLSLKRAHFTKKFKTTLF